MYWWVAQLLWSLAFTIVAELIRPKVKPDSPNPASLDDFSIPTADEGRAIPAVFGTCRITGSNTTWYGDLEVVPIKKKVKTGLWSSSKITIGYKYLLGLESTLCYGTVDELVSIEFGDVEAGMSQTVSADEVVVNINKPDLFGGDEKEGGIVGKMRFYLGTPAQTANAYMEDVLGKPMPAYRGVCRMVFEHVYLGTSTYLKAPAYVIKRQPNSLGLTGGKHIIGDDANPACIIHEVLTNQLWGAGVPETLIDMGTLTTLGNTCYDEGLGLSMIFNGGTTAEDLLVEVLRHIDGTMYTDPLTGQLTFKLMRDDYDIEELPEFGEDEITSMDFSRGSWNETSNTVKVKFVDRSQHFTIRTMQAQDLAIVHGRDGEIATQEVEMLGFSTAEAAQFAANRTLRTVAYPLSRSRITMNRKGFVLRPGSVFKLNWPAFDIESMVVRVTNINFGGMFDNKIEVDVVEDIFNVSEALYALPPPTEWEDPVGAPEPLAYQHAFEAPYHMLGDASRYIATVGARDNVSDIGYQTWQDTAGGTAYAKTGSVYEFAPVGILRSGYPSNTAADDATGFVIDPGKGLSELGSVTSEDRAGGDTLALIKSAAGEEIVAWQTVTPTGDGGYTISDVLRGVLDTLPLSHDAGAEVWFITEGVGLLSESPYIANSTITGKLPTIGAGSVLDIGDATQLSVTLAQRAQKPYPPANILIDGEPGGEITGDADITWSIRHRVDQYVNGDIVAQDAASYTATPEGGYELRIYVDEVLIRTVDIDSAPFDSYTYDTSTRTSDNADLTLPTRVEIRAVNGSYASVWRSSANFYFDGSALEDLAIATTSPLPNGEPGEAYSYTMAATGGEPPYTWEVLSGGEGDFAITPIDALTGTITGTPSSEHVYSLEIQVTDNVGATDSATFQLAVINDCAPYTVPPSEGHTFPIIYEEEPLEAEGNTLHICNGVGDYAVEDLFSSGEGGGWYDFTDPTTLWQDLAGTTPVTTDGDLVMRVDDLSGNGNFLRCLGDVGHRVYYRDVGGVRYCELEDVGSGSPVDGVVWDSLPVIRSGAATEFTIGAAYEHVSGDGRHMEVQLYAREIPHTPSNTRYVRLGHAYVNTPLRAIAEYYEPDPYYLNTNTATVSGSPTYGPHASVAEFDLSAESPAPAVESLYTSGFDAESDVVTTLGSWGEDGLASGHQQYLTVRLHRAYAVVIVERAVTTDEKAALTTYLNTKAGL